MMDEVVLPPGLTRLSPGAHCCLGHPSVGRETTRHAGGGSDLGRAVASGTRPWTVRPAPHRARPASASQKSHITTIGEARPFVTGGVDTHLRAAGARAAGQAEPPYPVSSAAGPRPR